MEVLQVAKSMLKVIEAIKVEGQRSAVLIADEARTMRDYDKMIAVKELEHKAAGVPVTILKDQAKGDASEALCDMIVAQKTLKAHWQRLDYLKAQLNAYQSINRHLEST